jgi:hypothetical protein
MLSKQASTQNQTRRNSQYSFHTFFHLVYAAKKQRQYYLKMN